MDPTSSHPHCQPLPDQHLTMPTRAPSVFSVPAPDDQARPPFTLEHTKDAYTKQYANLYWLRLVVLRPRVEKRAKAAWAVKTNKHVKGKLHC